MTPNDAFLRQWTAAQPVLASFVGSLVRDRHAGDDIVQEVAVVAWGKFAQFDSSRPFLPWVLGIARCEVIERRRKLARSFITFHAEVMDAVSAEFERQADELSASREALQVCLGELPVRAQDYVRLRYQEDLAPADIAHRLGRDVNAVRVALHRLRGVLESCIRRRLGHEGLAP